MAKKVSKNQRTNRVQNAASQRSMVKIVAATKKGNGQYSFRQKMVDAESLQAELKAAQA